MEVVAQRGHDVAQLLRRQEIGRAAAEVKLDDVAIAVEHLRRHCDLADEARNIGFRQRPVAGDDPVAAAVEARARAEWHVHVDRQRAGDRFGVAFANDLAQRRLVENQR
jgi:hypothetical protein